MRFAVILFLMLSTMEVEAQSSLRDTLLYKSVESGEMTRRNIRTIQRELQLLGYRPGFADGFFGPRTQRAIAAWQKDTGQRVRGLGLAPGEVEIGLRAICGGGALREMRGTSKTSGGVCY